MKEVALKEGRELPRYNDAMEWLEQVAKGALMTRQRYN